MNNAAPAGAMDLIATTWDVPSAGQIFPVDGKIKGPQNDTPIGGPLPEALEEHRCTESGCTKPRWLSWDKCVEHKPYPVWPGGQPPRNDGMPRIQAGLELPDFTERLAEQVTS